MDECRQIQSSHSTKLYFDKEVSMGTDTKSTPVRVDAGIGIFWFIGWLFTIAFAKLVWWQVLLGLVVWPYFLGVAAR
jgi:hypothetical protein